MKILSREKIELAKRIRRELMTWEDVDDLLYKEFSRLSENVNVREVAYKAAILDGLYNCRLSITPNETAELIVDAKIDDDLRNGHPVDLIERIVPIEGEKRGNQKRANIGVVFASKYCHFHEPTRFAIYDQFAHLALQDMLGMKIKERNYRQMKAGVDKIKDDTGFSYNDIDEYLWLYGQYLAHQAYLAHQTKKPIAIVSKYPERFAELIPEERQ